MIKSKTGGKRGTSQITSNIAQSTSTSNTYQTFMNSNDDGKAKIIDTAISTAIPKYLANASLQKFIYNTEMNDAPDVVTDKQLDAMNGVEIFRTVNEFKDGRLRMKWTAPEIAEQFQYGDITRTNAGGGTMLGHGIYFADNFSHSQRNYGSYMNDINKTATLRAKLNSNARVYDYYKAVQDARSEINSGSELGKVLQKADSDSRGAIWALSRGYNVLKDSGSGYYVILSRKALTVSSTIKSKEGNSKW